MLSITARSTPAAIVVFLTGICSVTTAPISQASLPQNGYFLESRKLPTNTKAKAVKNKSNTFSLPKFSFRLPARTTFNNSDQRDIAGLRIANPVAGRFVYAYTKYYDETNKTYLVVCDIKNPGTAKSSQVKNLKRTYTAQRIPSYKGTLIFDPQLSPDGRYVLFKFGLPWLEFGRYYLYVLDIQTNQLRQVTDRLLSYGSVSWSPDGTCISYVNYGNRLGGTQGDFGTYVGPRTLYLCQWRTGKEFLVTQNDMVARPFSWIPPHSLVYSALSPQSQKQLTQQSASKGQIDKASTLKASPRPDIFKYNLERNKSEVLIKDGVFPSVSPGGKRVGFFGSEDPRQPLPLNSNWQYESGGSALSIFNLQNYERTALNVSSGGLYPSLLWRHDENLLLTLSQSKAQLTNTAELVEWDLTTKRFRKVTALRTLDSQDIAFSVISPPFTLFGISNDGDSIFVSGRQWLPEDPNTSISIATTSLYKVSLVTGQVTEILQTTGTSGIDWHEGNAAATSK